MVLTSGTAIAARYQLRRRIAVGGMGEVWEATDERLERTVAVKVLKTEIGSDPEFLERFRAEARIAASINHHNIAGVHDYGEDTTGDGPPTAYLVMELVRGEPLSRRLASQGSLGSVLTLDLLEQAARGLAAAHARGFVHRDVKPGNILLAEDGTVKLTDFGIAKAAESASVTAAGTVMGTAHYIAPEQARGAEAGPVGDVYSLGVVGYECLAGHRPFDDTSPVTIAMMHLNDPVPPLPEQISARIRALIAAALVKNPEKRYRDGAEFAKAVAAVRRGQPPPIPDHPVPAPAGSGSDSGAETDAGAGSGAGSGSEPGAGSDSGSNSGAASNSGAGAGSGARGGAGHGMETGSEADSGSSSSPPDSGSGAGSGTGPYSVVAARSSSGDREAGPPSDGFAVAGPAGPELPPPGRMPPAQRARIPAGGIRPLPSPSSRRRGGLTAAFVLLTVAAVAIGVLMVRHAALPRRSVGVPGAPAGVSAPAHPPDTTDTTDTDSTDSTGDTGGAGAGTETGPAAGDSVLIDLAAYTGRPVNQVDDELRGRGLRTAIRATTGGGPTAPAGCAVTDISPAGAVRPGTVVTITCAQR